MKLIDADKILEALGAFTDEKHGDPHFLNGIETARVIVEQMPVASPEAIMEWCKNWNLSIITDELLHYLMSVATDHDDDICFFRQTLGES